MTLYNQDDEFFSDQDRVLRFVLDATDDLPDLDNVTAIEWEMTVDATQAPVLQKSLGGGIAIFDSATRVIDVTIDSTDLPALHGIFEHMLKVTSDGKEAPVAVGHIQLNRSHIV